MVKKGNIKEERIYLGDYEIFRKFVGSSIDTERETVHISDDNQKIAQIDGETIRYQLSDHLGSASLELDENAEIISYEEYYPFGTTSYRSGRNETEVSQKRYKYVMKELDNETGLYYYGMRFYASWICRFVSVDPLQHDYLYYTPYQYAGNMPISNIDLDGAEPENKVDKKREKTARNTIKSITSIKFSIKSRVDLEVYDNNFWKLETVKAREGVMRVVENKKPSKALKSILKSPELYSVDCAEFVRIIQLNVLRKELNNKEFNKYFENLYIYSYWSSGINFKHTYLRNTPYDLFWDEQVNVYDYQLEHSYFYKGESLDIEKVLEELPIGSNIAITNLDADKDAPFRNENMIKAGKNSDGEIEWAAHGWGKQKIFTLDELERLMANSTTDNVTDEYIEQKIFISKIEVLDR